MFIDRLKHVPSQPQTGEPAEPELLPSGGSAAEERLREAEHQQGRAPARKGAEPNSD